MAEAFGVAAGSLTVLELTAKLVKQCKHLIETAQDAPRDLKHIFIEISSLKGILDSFDVISNAAVGPSSSTPDSSEVIEGCRGTIEELARELDGLSISNASQPSDGKRQRIQAAIKWTMKESKTRKLLDETMQHKTTLMLHLLGDVTRDIQHMKGTVSSVHEQLNSSQRQKIYDWIEHTNPTAIHNQSCKNHEALTCQWIHQVDQWHDWLSCKRRTIWVHGIPGAGKTVLASYLIQQTIEHCERRRNDRRSCLYYYCSFRHGQGDRQNECEPFLRWIVSQLCRKANLIPQILVQCYQQSASPELDALKCALNELLQDTNCIYIILDAADESSPREDLLLLIEELATHPNFQKIQLLVTSRRYADIERILRPISEPSLPMSNSIVDTDIRLYTSAILARNERLRKWPDDLKSDILEGLVHGAQGMFRWVVCQFHRLQRKTPRQARKALKDLPETLDETYERILQEIPREDWTVARSALRWICGHADLLFEESIPIYCLVAAISGMDSPIAPEDPKAVIESEEYQRLDDILGCLIQEEFVDSVYHAASLAHYTVQEYLVSDRIAQGPASYFTISKDSCAYEMLATVFERQTFFSEDTLYAHYSEDFDKYCYDIARYGHVPWETMLSQDKSTWRRLRQLFYKHTFISLEDDEAIDLSYANYSSGSSMDFVHDADSNRAKHFLAVLGLGCTRLLHEIVHELDVEATLSAEVISEASYSKWVEAVPPDPLPGFVTILDEVGIHAAEDSSYLYMALIKSLESWNEPSKLLLFCVAAHYHECTCGYDNWCVIENQLNSGADATPQDFLITPLQIATRNWDYAGVNTLLKHGADPNATGCAGGYKPAHLDGRWAFSSPLHALRNAEYAFMAAECYTDLKAKREEFRAKIEALLLEYGAKDFTVDPLSLEKEKLAVRSLLS